MSSLLERMDVLSNNRLCPKPKRLMHSGAQHICDSWELVGVTPACCRMVLRHCTKRQQSREISSHMQTTEFMPSRQRKQHAQEP